MSRQDNKLAKYIKLILPIVSLALITTIFYCIGWNYLDSYYSRLGISLNSLHLSTVFYLQSSVIPLVSLLFLIFLLISVSNMLKLKQYKKYSINKNSKLFLLTKLFNYTDLLSIFIMILIFTINIYLGSYTLLSGIIKGYVVYLINMKLIFIFCITFILANCTDIIDNYFYVSFIIDYKKYSRYLKRKLILYFIVFIALFNIYILIISVDDAENLVEGKLFSSSLVTLEFKKTFKEENVNINLKNKELIFVVYANDSYYLVDKQIPAPKSPDIYVIPKDEIKWIKFNRITD